MSHAGCSQRSKYACVQAATARCEPFGTQAQALRPPRACRSFSACRAASLERRALFVWHLQYGPSSSRPDRRHAALWSRHRSAAAVTMAASVSQLACHTAPRQPGPRAGSSARPRWRRRAGCRPAALPPDPATMAASAVRQGSRLQWDTIDTTKVRSP